MSMITTLQWLPRGYAAEHPKKYTFDEAEYARIAGLAQLRLDEAREDVEEAEAEQRSQRKQNGEAAGDKMDDGEDDDLKEYNLEAYDDDEEEEKEDEGQKPKRMEMFGNVRALAYHESNDDDPYITLGKNGDRHRDDASDGSSERSALHILPSDNLLIAGKVEDEVSYLDIYVYEDGADNLYVHHDIMLPAIPLCVEWLDLVPGSSSNERGCYIAVGTLDPDIEVWDLDVVEGMYPTAILGKGGEVQPNGETRIDDEWEDEDEDDDVAKRKRKKKEKKKKKKARPKSNAPNDDYHVDAVLSLAANRQHRNLLASASADSTVKLWDLHTAKCAKSYTYHSDKVCSLAWHAAQAEVLLSGSYDRSVVLADMRAPDAQRPRWGVESDVEVVRWDPHEGNCFFVSTEGGMVHYYDARQGSSSAGAGATSSKPQHDKNKPIWTLSAHGKAVSTLDINPVVPGFLATGSPDKQVKLWNLSSFGEGGGVGVGKGPSLIAERNLDVGKVFGVTFAPDDEVGFRLAVAGSEGGGVQIWDTATNSAVRRCFGPRMKAAALRNGDDERKERVVGLAEDSSDDEVEGGVRRGGHEDMDED